MSEARLNISSLLERMALFQGLEENEIAYVADQFQVLRLEEGESIFKEGDRADVFYIVYSGRVKATRGKDKNFRDLVVYVPGDHFGEEALIKNRTRVFSVTALDQTVILCLDRDEFFGILRRFPNAKQYLIKVIESRQLARLVGFDWLGKNETIYMLTRKHIAHLIVSLIPPLVAGWLGIILLYFSAVSEASSVAALLQWLGVGAVVFAIAWGVWRYVDWRNDYYIVTNHRVLAMEKVVAIMDSRLEAPLGTILTVSLNRDFLGRLLGYGDVVVRTYTGQVILQHIGLPEQVAGLVEEQLGRSKQQAQAEEEIALERAIRLRLGMEPGEEAPVKSESELISPRIVRAGQFGSLFSDFFKVRYEVGGVITFRKHWVLLLYRIWAPTLLTVLVFAGLIARFLNVVIFLSISSSLLIGLTLFVILAIWWIYEYVDWRNDIYQVTSEQIIDIYRKPLGREERHAAPLENILSLEHERIGIVGLILNYGNVIAMVGTAKFTFDGVYNPPGVQQEIFMKMNERKDRLRQAEAEREREHIADWLAAYHRQIEAARRSGNLPK